VADDPRRVSTAGFWEGLYAGGQDGWELGGPAPALLDWLDRGGTFAGEERAGDTLPAAPAASAEPGSLPPRWSSPVAARVAVPGCGRGHDARLLARKGYRVWAFDFAEAATAEARRLAARESVDLTVEQRDVFSLAEAYRGAFDAVWEYTCFCAIDPARRAEYVDVLRAVLRPGGTLLACFYPIRDGYDGPPFPVRVAEVERLLAGGFAIVEAGPPARSAERRQGLEHLVRAVRH
jgi:SAM-dependent methyltransferase